MPAPKSLWTIAICVVLSAAPVSAMSTSQGDVNVALMADGLDQPWGLGFLPNGGFLVTERDGRLLHFDSSGARQTVRGAPRVFNEGQGGLLDVMVPCDFARTRQVYLSYAKPQAEGAGTALARGRLSTDGSRLTGVETIFEAAPGFSGGRHFGSRVVEGADGTVFLTIGDRGARPSAQARNNHNGAVIRVNRDGSVPADNPFVGQTDIKPEIWSFGHRNPQGAALDAQGQLWTAEHGARGGDEVNLIRRGANFGWPVISYGRHYSGAKIGEGTQKQGMEQPAHYWDPSIAPSGMMIYSGKLWPQWTGDAFVGSLKFSHISRLELQGSDASEAEILKSDETSRVRDVVEAPDGAIWFLSVNTGAAYRMTPN